MIEFIKKAEYFQWIDAYSNLREDYPSAGIHNLKDIQDHFILDKLVGIKGCRILEIGGADCRALRLFSNENECWNAEKFEGEGGGPKKIIHTPGIRNAQVFLGEYSSELPDSYFDIVFSVSVIEHVETGRLSDFFNDIARVLKPDGRTFHAIDAYLFDHGSNLESWSLYTSERLSAYLNVPNMTHGMLSPAKQPQVDSYPYFSCSYASNADREMLKWNKYVPSLSPLRAIAQSCSLKCEWIRS